MSDTLTQGLIDILADGGFVMVPLIALSLVLFTSLFRLTFDLCRAARMGRSALIPERRNRETSLGEFETLVRERKQWSLQLQQRIKSVRVMAATAPLLGLLGTVAGMLKTFSAMSLRDGFEGVDTIAAGISEALITTETGLSVAIAGLIFLWAVKSYQERLLIRFESGDAARILADLATSSSC